MHCFFGKMEHWRQWLTGITVSLAALVTGLGNGWTSPYLAQLTASDTALPLKLTTTEASWVASLLNLGRFIGVVLGAVFQGFMGRKNTLLLGAVPLASGWICIMSATNVPLLYVARLLCGLASGIIWSALSLFLGEIAHPKIRGSLIFLNLNTTAVGTFLGNVMGPHLPMEYFSCVSLAATGLFVVLFSLVPETPHHHVVNGDAMRAEKSLRWYNPEADVKREVTELQDFIGSTSIGMAGRLKDFKRPMHRKNMAVMICLNIFLYFSGHNTMSYYAEIIITKSAIDLVPSTVVMALSFSTIVASATATVLVDKFGRRPLLVGSAIGATVALIMLGSHFHMLTSGLESRTYTWLPMIALFLYNCSLAYGLVPVPCVLIGELFPPVIKTTAAMSFSVTSALLSFITAKTFQPFLDLVGEKYVFWTFATSSMASALFAYIYVPETNGKSLAEIQFSMERESDVDESKHAENKVCVDA